ncbi:MAG TPA: class I tRNA ligase family protein, partial [Candidatus Nanoarchaeia archaeon]|nr:class I tRNA ligase family protein [Candidatus Nanoarchaeia archaeon]
GKKAKVPLFDFEVPILEDKRADPEKGTGIVMCCTFGDQTDMEWQKVHKLQIKEAITKDGKMSHLAGKYKGMTMKEARSQLIEDMRQQGLLKNQKSIKHFVNVHERCDTEIEFIKTKQWFVRYLDLRKDMLKWGAKLKWHPKFMKSRYDNWVNGLQWDWLISNQRYHGVPFPVWYCEKCDKVFLAEESKLPVDPLKDAPPREKCGCGGKLVGERDIFNTWFTSSLTPTIAAKLRPEIEDKVKFMDLRPQAHDIITFWLFNTVVKSNIHYGKNPWKNVMISGFVTLEGQKMSKSKGNVVEPQAVTEQHGADALRFWAAGSKLGEDLDYQEKDILTARKFITKLFNASNFVFMNLKDYNYKKPAKIEKIDSLFLEKLNYLIKTATSTFEEYEYSRAKTETERFFWHEFCDNYLEIVKKRIYNNKKGKESAQYVLYHSLLVLLKMIAPIMPFITEEIYLEHYAKIEKEKSIHISQWPKAEKGKKAKGEKVEKGKKAKEGEKEEPEGWELFTDILAKIRQEKTRMQKAMNCEITLKLEKEDMKKIGELVEDLKDVMNIKEIKEGKFKVEF